MIVGADENAIVTQPRIDVATQQTGHSIEFWGRYFKNSGNTSPEQYQPNQEAALLNQNNIRVLPIGRQTGHVAGSESLGRADGTTNAKAIIGKFVLPAVPQLAVVAAVPRPGAAPKARKSEPRNRRRDAPLAKSAPGSRRRSETRGKRDRERKPLDHDSRYDGARCRASEREGACAL